MVTNVKTITPNEPAENVARLMVVHGIHHVVVMDSGKVVGVVSERDLGGRRSPKKLTGVSVRDVMSRQLVSSTPTATVRQAANLFRGRGIGCLPILEDGKLRGIVTTADLLELIGRGSDRPVHRTARATISRPKGKLTQKS